MSSHEIVRILGSNAVAVQRQILEIGDTYNGESTAVIESRIRDLINQVGLEPSEFTAAIAQRIVDGHRGQAIFDF